MLTRVEGDPASHDVQVGEGWRLKLKAPLAGYDLHVATDPVLAGVTLEARRGPGWLRLVRDLTPFMAGGGHFQIDLHLRQFGPAPLEWVGLLREEKGDQRFHARPTSKLAGNGRVGLTVTVDPPGAGVAYVLAISLAAFPAHIAASAVTCVSLDQEPAEMPAGPLDRAALARAVQAYLWDDYYAATHRLPRNAAPGTLVAHFLEEALDAGHLDANDLDADRAPNPLFDARYYRRQLALRGLPEVATGESAFLHWLAVGRPHRIVPTALFDEAEYRDANPVPSGVDGYEHYLGEGFRHDFSPSQFFDARWYARRHGVDPRMPAMLQYATVGAAAGLAPSPDIPPPRPVARGLALDRFAADLRLRTAALPPALIAGAALIEPQILQPAGPRRLTVAPCKHSMARPAYAGALVRDRLAGQLHDTLMLVAQPSAAETTLADTLVRALVAIRPDERVLLVMTERSDLARPEPFPPAADLLDLPGELGADLPDDLVPVLLDLARGLAIRRLITVGGGAGWRLMARYGRQLSAAMALYACPVDHEAEGVGVPGSPPGFDHLDGILADPASPAELQARHASSIAANPARHDQQSFAQELNARLADDAQASDRE